ncbi:MAG: GntR family transcriptional regulator [Hyphomicrobiaceae bacterium]
MCNIKPIMGSSLRSEAFDKVVEARTSGEFELGQRLSEAELARQLGISRGPLREALGRLEGRLVRRTPRIGVHVIDFSREDIEALFLTREALEGMAARLACEKLSAKQLQHLRDMLADDAHRPEVASGARYAPRTRDEDFHFSIIRAAANDRIERLLMDEVYYQLRIQRRKSSAQPGRTMAALKEHHQIVAALERRNPDEAERAMRMHLRNARISAMAAVEAQEAEAI